MNSSWGRALGVALIVIAGWACDEEETGARCADDDACERGQICDDGACSTVQCNGLQDCPGSGRTCLFDLRSCSIKECNDANGRVCGGDRPICVQEGVYRNSCIGASQACGVSADCAPLGAGYQCCSGMCSTECADMNVIPIGDDQGVAPDAAADGGVVDADGGVEPDGGAPPAGGKLCAACGNDADCAELGEGAKCTPLGGDQVCSSACAGPGDCPAGFQCVDGLDQCLPISFECVGCLVEPCADGQVCNFGNGECTDPRGECGLCTGDADCAAGLTCGPLGEAQHCFAACDGGCPEGQMCADGQCKPGTGVCDACGGRCSGDTPACIEAEGRCAECGPGVQCAEGFSCNAVTFTCEQGGAGCNSDLDCVAPTPVCFGGECVACLVDEDCPARQACTPEQTCIPDNCRGVACQAENACNDDTGRCEPGCMNDADCNAPDVLRCNGATGQCFYVDGTCDLDAATGVCGPGSRCEPGLAGLIHGPTRGNCSCEVNPDPNQTGCQPGTICPDLSMFMLPSTCGINPFAP